MTCQRPYQRTHPWLTFQLDLRRLSHWDWLTLGRVAANCWHVAAAPLEPQVSEEIHKIYLAKGALATTAIEGNTLSEEEALAAVAGHLKLPPSRQYLKREVDNIVTACNELAAKLETDGEIPITVEYLERMNKLVLDGLEVDDHVSPGRVRTENVTVGRYHCPEGHDAGFLLHRLCDTLNDLSASDLGKFEFAILKAVFAHIYFVWIHPFGDGNGRAGRLLEFAILLEAGLPQPTCHLLSNHYNMTRTKYYRELERASRTQEGIYGFVTYALHGLQDGLDEQISMIRRRLWEVAWVHFVHEQFRAPRNNVERRRRTLALALTSLTDSVTFDDLPNLTPDVARAYANCSRRTLMRDVQALQDRGLLTPDGAALSINRKHILKFLPWRHAPDINSLLNTET